MAIRAGLEAEGIATDFVTVEEETRTNVMILDLSNGRHIKVNQAGAPVSMAAQEEFRTCVHRHLRPGDLWALTGSLAPGLPTDFYAELIDILHAGGAWAALDTSGPALRAGCAAHPDLVKPNASKAYDFTEERVSSL